MAHARGAARDHYARPMQLQRAPARRAASAVSPFANISASVQPSGDATSSSSAGRRSNGRLHGHLRYRNSVRHEAADGTCRQQLARHAAEDPLAQATVPIGAGDQQIGAFFASDPD